MESSTSAVASSLTEAEAKSFNREWKDVCCYDTAFALSALRKSFNREWKGSLYEKVSRYPAEIRKSFNREWKVNLEGNSVLEKNFGKGRVSIENGKMLVPALTWSLPSPQKSFNREWKVQVLGSDKGKTFSVRRVSIENGKL